MTLLILAGGRGSRYGGLKQFDGLGPHKEYLLEYTMYDAIRAGFERIVMVVSPGQQEELYDHFRSKLPNTVAFTCLEQRMDDVPEGFLIPQERTKPWGTAHAVWSARHELKGPFATVNADDFYGRIALENAFQLGQNLRANEYALVGYALKDTLSENGTVSRGVCIIESERLKEVREYTHLQQRDDHVVDQTSGKHFTGTELVSMNLWVLQPSLFEEIENGFSAFLAQKENTLNAELYLPAMIQNLINRSEVDVIASDGKSNWSGLTYQEDREQLVQQLADLTTNGTYPSPLWT